MRLRECDACDEQIADHDLVDSGWCVVSDAGGWTADACSEHCALSLLAEHHETLAERKAS